MAGISTTFPFKPSPTTTSPSTRTSSPKVFVSSSFALKFATKTTAFRCRVRSVSTTGTVVVVARYGGRGGYRPGPRPSRPPNRGGRGGGSDSDDDALDISRLATNSVRLIDENQNMVGIVSVNEAIQMADDAERDLVILSEDADPPVLRIMDYNKYKYEQQKRKRDQQKKSAATRMDIKELKMGYNIDSHDYSVRLKAAQKFLKDGDKVKIIVNLKGRQNEFRNNAIELIKRFQNDVGELASEESKNFRDRNVFMVLIPNKTVIQKVQEQPKKKDASVNKVSANV